MNILNSIGGGLLSGVRGVGQGLAAAGGGINKYINAMGMDSALSAGIPQDQLTPQAMRGAGRNWLASIGQGMQTGDYVGARQDMQKEMLAKVQMLQQMKQQQAAKDTLAAFQSEMGQADTLEKQIAVARKYPQFGDMSSTILNANKIQPEISVQNAQAQDLLAQAKQRAAAASPGKEAIKVEGIGDWTYVLFKDGSREIFTDPSGAPVPNKDGRFLNTGSGLFDQKAEKYVKPDDSMDENSIDQHNRVWKQAYIQAGGKADVFDKTFALPEKATFKTASEQAEAVKSAIGTINGRVHDSTTSKQVSSEQMAQALPLVADQVARGVITYSQGASALGGARSQGGALLSVELAKRDAQFFPPQVKAQFQEITTSRSLVEGLRDTINKIQEASDPKKRTELTMLLKGQADAVTARMARANGEKGVLTDQDISRATGLIPGWSSANFNKQFADQQLDLINSNFDRVEQSIRSSYYPGARPPAPQAAPAPASSGGWSVRVKK